MQRPASTAPLGAHLARERGEQAGLAAARLAGHHDDAGCPGARPLPRGAQRRELRVPAHERRVVAAGERRRQRLRARRLRARPRRRAQRLDQRARLGRWRHAIVAPQGRAQRFVDGDGRRTVTGTRQALHERACRLLGCGLELEPAARMASRGLEVAGRLGRSAQAVQDRRHAVAMQRPLLQHPVVVQVAQEIAVAQLQRTLQVAFREQSLGLPDVDPDGRPVLDAHAVATGVDESGGLVAGLPAQRRQCRPQACPGTALEHVRPEDRRDPGARMQPRVVGQPGQERARARARDRIEGALAGVQPELADEAHPQHFADRSQRRACPWSRR